MDESIFPVDGVPIMDYWTDDGCSHITVVEDRYTKEQYKVTVTYADRMPSLLEIITGT